MLKELPLIFCRRRGADWGISIMISCRIPFYILYRDAERDPRSYVRIYAWLLLHGLPFYKCWFIYYRLYSEIKVRSGHAHIKAKRSRMHSLPLHFRTVLLGCASLYHLITLHVWYIRGERVLCCLKLIKKNINSVLSAWKLLPALMLLDFAEDTPLELITRLTNQWLIHWRPHTPILNGGLLDLT